MTAGPPESSPLKEWVCFLVIVVRAVKMVIIADERFFNRQIYDKFFAIASGILIT